MTRKEYIKYIRERMSTLFSRKSIFGEFQLSAASSKPEDDDKVEAVVLTYKHITSADDIIEHNNSARGDIDYNALALEADIAIEADMQIALSGIAAIEGNGHTIHLRGKRTTPLFEEIMSQTELSNLHIAGDKCYIVGRNAVGALVGSVMADAALRNITIEGISLEATDGIAGGMVGIVTRHDKHNRDEHVTLIVENCTIKECHISATKAAGKYIGMLRGYDPSETIIIEHSTIENVTIEGAKSLYIDANKSSWLDEVDFTPYDAWLGMQEYHRGNIIINSAALSLRWDGVTAITPLLAEVRYDGTNIISGEKRYVVYTPFDLAGVRREGDSPKAIYLKADIDMFGQGEDGIYRIPEEFDSATESADDNDFEPFFEVETLDGRGNDGKNHTIFNLSIYQLEQMHSAFIRHASGYTVHHHINFANCRTATTHKVVERDAKSYGAILVGRIDSVIYTMDDVHAYDCKVYALQKGGPLAARVAAKQSYIRNCTTHNCYVENYQCWITERFDSGYMNLGLFKARAYVDYYPHGEMGGMFGFVQNNSEISNCHVYGATVNAYGQDDVMATMLAPEWGRELIDKYGYYKVPGRHASTFIGDIRATGIINIKNCTADAESRCTRQYNCHSSRIPHIGQCYIVKFEDKEGSVTIDGVPVMIADCNKWTDLENDTMLKQEVK